MRGLIIRNTGSWYIVRTDDGQLLECKIKGNFRLKGIRSTNPVAVGDYVTVVSGPDGATGLINGIEDRRNYVIRKASNLSKQSHIIAANVDLAALIVTISQPETSTTFIDRFLASTEAYDIPVLIVFNKVDILDDDETARMSQLADLYCSIGYDCIMCSAARGDGLGRLEEYLKDKVTLLSGNSGVGKSTLLNRLVPGAEARTADISTAHGTGTHTTTFSQMFFLPSGGSIIDTPGIKGFGTFDMERYEVTHYFKEIFSVGAECRFSNCTHTNEPGCAVLKAVEDGRIALSRYSSYLSVLDDEGDSKYRQGY